MSAQSDTDPRTISDRLLEAGFGHRADERTEVTGQRVVYRIATGEVVGRFRAHGALQLLSQP